MVKSKNAKKREMRSQACWCARSESYKVFRGKNGAAQQTKFSLSAE
jgi:hypothetical protein